MSWYEPWTWNDDDPPALGQQGNPSNYTKSADPNGFGGPGQIFGGGQVPYGSLNLPYFQQDRDRLGGMLDGQSAFAGSEWGGLISQLQQRSSGQGPSVAGDAYKQASANTNNQLMSMSSNSSSPAAARQALLQTGQVNQGMAQGYSAARNQEMMGATGQLSQALGSRDQLNQNAYTNILAQQLGLSQGQLKAGMANQQYNLGQGDQAQRARAADLNYFSSLLGGMAKGMGGV
jgi:hypothetical protein